MPHHDLMSLDPSYSRTVSSVLPNQLPQQHTCILACSRADHTPVTCRHPTHAVPRARGRNNAFIPTDDATNNTPCTPLSPHPCLPAQNPPVLLIPSSTFILRPFKPRLEVGRCVTGPVLCSGNNQRGQWVAREVSNHARRGLVDKLVVVRVLLRQREQQHAPGLRAREVHQHRALPTVALSSVPD
eukprot:2483041-Rhodomonas_salina.3